MTDTTLTLKLDTVKKIEAVRKALKSGYRKGMWSRQEMQKGLANMNRAEAALLARIESN